MSALRLRSLSKAGSAFDVDSSNRFAIINLVALSKNHVS
jgi:hypothetical protein